MKTRLPLLALALLVGCAPVDEDMDGFTADVDCNDHDNLVFPGGDEICDGIDNDCSGVIDDNYASGEGFVFYLDADGDGYGATTGTAVSCTPPEGFVNNASDCNDNEASINPRADELCNDLDDNCNGAVDEDAVDAPTWHADWDQDGFGSRTLVVKACEAPQGYITDSLDCNDFDVFTNPVADELCDFVDNNCDGVIDEDTAVDAKNWYEDLDTDGYGDITKPRLACFAPEGYAGNGDDCADDDYTTNPGAEEICRDGADNNCNGSADHCSITAWTNTDAASLSWVGKTSSGYLGYDIDFVGDIDGDGLEDMIMGAYRDFNTISYSGLIHVVYGDDTYEPENVQRKTNALPGFQGTATYEYLGIGTGPAGDVDGDGYADFLMGAYGAASYAGRAYLVYGGPTRFTNPSTPATNNPYVQGAGSSNYLGRAVYGGMDMDADGYSEWATGAYQPYSYAGAVYLNYGKSSRYSGALTATSSAAYWKGSGSSSYLGYNPGAIGGGDFNGDGFGDMTMGEYRSSRGVSYAGAVYVIYGSGTRPSGENPVAEVDNVMTGGSSYDYLGYSGGSAGDINDDGYEDLVGGAYGASSYGGALYIKFGSSDEIGTMSAGDADLTMLGYGSSTYLGYNHAAFGDFDGDGIGDIAGGAYRQTTPGGSYNGAIYVLRGGPDVGGEYDLSAMDHDLTIGGPSGTYAYFGYSQSAGDFNGDGYDELIGGAYGYSSYYGAVFLFEGTNL